MVQNYFSGELADVLPPSLRRRRRFEEFYRGFMYQKIASATRATVMIHKTMSLLRFFSSAIEEEYSTPLAPVQVPR